MKNFKCKILFSVLVFSFVSVFANAQKKYSTKDDEFLILKTDSTFSYWENCHGCMVGCNHGEGNYIRKGNEFHLKFNSFIDKSKIEFQIEKLTIESDSIEINFSFYDTDNEMMPGVNIMLDRNKGLQSDFDGKAKLKFKNYKIIDSVRIFFLGFERIIYLQPISQSIIVKMDFSHLERIYDVEIKFKKPLFRKKLKRIK